MGFENIKVEYSGRLAYIIINRPEVRNALNKHTLDEMKQALEELKTNRDVGCVVFTGAGEKSFAAGADIAQLNEKGMLDALQSGSMQEFYDYIELYEKPTIAMINGFALGGGCELAMAADIRIASTNAKLGLPELNLSIIPGAGGTQRLARIVGKGKALEMILTGKIITAEEAERIGLVSAVAEPAQLQAKVEEVAEQILAKGPLAVRLAKLSVHYGTETDIKTGLLIEKLSQAILFATEDKQEGTRAFLEKRKANFQGK
ncbi:Enoyl-CoA hydratase/isomerase [Caldalkalibacillus thermarum TA2.A1]|uniref:Enoyl-CoA hydratase/isomerase n=1 Tax=Caldalkalibacillus thermarum (strain TA2.A1) TaxID=986075 RepID=F5L5Y3_CALTT|nr:enoyl-CoA hydratase-related protein [Caldalkalibacillus thermarum]EGL83256.1 Enoyl-CoA hydratase/isomerase [Caldalkalibacillus thermarum TA2.A1]QZT33575.1 enoyl-CoA hydratase/isomerase family protein [Caldalkalibacillus thermarum TA2.A1]